MLRIGTDTGIRATLIYAISVHQLGKKNIISIIMIKIFNNLFWLIYRLNEK